MHIGNAHDDKHSGCYEFPKFATLLFCQNTVSKSVQERSRLLGAPLLRASAESNANSVVTMSIYLAAGKGSVADSNATTDGRRKGLIYYSHHELEKVRLEG
jgi:hypothetical protein